MAFRRTGRAGHIVAQKRKTTWLELQPARTTHTTTTGTIIFSLTATELALRPFTIVRTRLLVGIESDQAATSEGQLGGLGIAVVSDQASAVGVTAVPLPIDDMESDLWLVHQLMYNTFVFGSGIGFSDDGLHQYDIDSKAMRKVDIGQDVVVVVQRSGNGDGFNVFVGGRMLIKVN